MAFSSYRQEFSLGWNFDFPSSALLKLSCAHESGDGVCSCEHGCRSAFLGPQPMSEVIGGESRNTNLKLPEGELATGSKCWEGEASKSGESNAMKGSRHKGLEPTDG